MKIWILDCSIDAIGIDHTEIIHSDSEPDFWTCHDIATAHGCSWYTLIEIKEGIQCLSYV